MKKTRKPLSAETRAKISASRKLNTPRTGADAPNWRGGRVVDYRGYVRLLVGRGQPMTNRDGYVWEHRLVMAESLGRPLESHELVHHLDQDKTNNALENLALVTADQHRAIHALIDIGWSPEDAAKTVFAGPKDRASSAAAGGNARADAAADPPAASANHWDGAVGARGASW